jgi:hypothetical protein
LPAIRLTVTLLTCVPHLFSMTRRTRSMAPLKAHLRDAQAQHLLAAQPALERLRVELDISPDLQDLQRQGTDPGQDGLRLEAVGLTALFPIICIAVAIALS